MSGAILYGATVETGGQVDLRIKDDAIRLLIVDEFAGVSAHTYLTPGEAWDLSVALREACAQVSPGNQP